MTQEEKIQLLHTAQEALGGLMRMPLDPLPEVISQPLCDACLDAVGGLSGLVTRLELEIGTDNL